MFRFLSSSSLIAHICPPIAYSLHRHSPSTTIKSRFGVLAYLNAVKPWDFQNVISSKVLFDHRVWYFKGSDFHYAIQLYESSSQTKFLLKCWSLFWLKTRVGQQYIFFPPLLQQQQHFCSLKHCSFSEYCNFSEYCTLIWKNISL